MQQQRQQQRINIRLEYEEPTSIGIDHYEIPVLAIVTRGEETVDGEEVKFFHGNQQDGSSITDENGRAEHIFEAQTSTRRLRFGAQVGGAYKNISVQLPAPKPKSEPYNIEVKLFREQDGFIYHIYLYDKNGRGCPGAVEITEEDNFSEVVQLDQDGMGVYQINIPKRKINVHFDVVSYDLETDHSLNPKKLRRHELPELPQNPNWWQKFVYGFKGGK